MELTVIQNKIYEIRGQRVMIDSDLAVLYQVETKYLKRAVNRNIQRFPPDFLFELTKEEYHFLRCNFGTLETGKGQYAKYLPYAFTEQGLAMLSGILNSAVAIEVNIHIMRAFVAIRKYALEASAVSREIDELRNRVKALELSGEETLGAVNDLSEDTRRSLDDIYIALSELAAKNKRGGSERPKIGYVK